MDVIVKRARIVTIRTLMLFALFSPLLNALNNPGVQAHNNPTFREDLLLRIPVNIGEPMSSETFAIQWPKKSVQLIWRVVDTESPADITFRLLQNGEVIAQELMTNAATNRFKGDGFMIQSESAEATPFLVELYVKVLDRSKKKN